MANEFNRNIQDAVLTLTKACPAAGATNYSDSLNLGARAHQVETVEVEIAIPAIAALADTKTLTIALQDSADDSSYAAVDPAISTSVVGVSTDGSTAKTVRFKLPPNVRQYVRFSQTAVASSGTITGSSVTYKLLF